MPWTTEEAREYASQGGKARAEKHRRRRDMTPAERAQEAIAAESGKLAQELLDAALGRGDFATTIPCPECEARVPVPYLDPKDRLGAVKAALTWGVGRPGAARGGGRQDDQPEDDSGLEVA